MRRFKVPIKDEERVVNDVEKSYRKTFDRAVNLLTYKPRSVGELRERLLEKKWTNREIVDRVIEKLSEYNYLDDNEYAYNLSVSKLRASNIGRRRIEQELQRKNLDPQTIESALERAFEETSENDLIERAVEKRIRIKGFPETPNEMKNFFGYLVRQGFEYDLIRDRMEALRNSNGET
ncbi:MAG: regulatory protein RecX [Pyrinomonadaceae bacterium]